MKVCAVIVTYGNRFTLLKKVIDRVLDEGVTKVIVVDNNSSKESREKLKEYEEKLKNKLKVLYLDRNYGSAGGFKRGLKEAYEDEDCEFIWLLDDDNLPLEGALDHLLLCWEKIDFDNKKEKLALASWRRSRIGQIKALIEDNPFLVVGGGPKNSFLGFHLMRFHFHLLNILKRFCKKNEIDVLQFLKYIEEKGINYGKIAVAPYGGLFFHKRLLEKIGYPEERLFVYEDDHEWTYRITKSGGEIILCLRSQITDLEPSWHMKTRKKILSAFFEGDEFRVYYYIRNRVFFENKHLVSSPFVYNLNRHVFETLLFILSLLYTKRERFKLIRKAIKDGFKLLEEVEA